MNSDRDSIRQDTYKIHVRIRELQTEIEVERLKLEIVRKRCQHPKRYLTTVMGDDTWRCPDCG